MAEPIGKLKATLIMGMLKIKVRSLESLNPDEDSCLEWILTKTQMKKLLQGIPYGWEVKAKPLRGQETEFKPLNAEWFIDNILKNFEGIIVYNSKTNLFELFETPYGSYILKPPSPAIIFLETEKSKRVARDKTVKKSSREPKREINDNYELFILPMLKYKNIYWVFYFIILLAKSKEPLFTGKISERLRDILQKSVENLDCEIVNLNISGNAIYILLKSPSRRSPFNIVKYLRRKTSDTLLQEFPELKEKIQGRHLWWRQGLFTVTPPEMEHYLKLHYYLQGKEAGNMETQDKYMGYLLSLAGERYPVGVLEAMGVATYEDLNKPRKLPKLIDLDFIREITKTAEQNAKIYKLEEFIRQHIESNETETLAVLLPEEMPWGSIAFAIQTLFNENHSLTEIAKAFRRDGLPVYHNTTGIDNYNPETKVKAFLFEDRHGHKIWLLKKA